MAFLAPAGATVLEVVRNYQQALLKAGMTASIRKADLKAESKAQLVEITKFLNADRAVEVIVVGHTDNAGSIESSPEAQATCTR